MTDKVEEIYAFKHNDITVFVKIDYVNNKISLMEKNQRGCNGWLQKQWLFAERGVEYMNGWLGILEAMQEAIKDAKKRYELDLAENSKFVENEMVEFVKKSSKK